MKDILLLGAYVFACMIVCVPLALGLTLLIALIDLLPGGIIPPWSYYASLVLCLDLMYAGFANTIVLENIERWRFSDWKIENNKLINVKWKSVAGSQRPNKNDPDGVIVLRKGAR